MHIALNGEWTLTVIMHDISDAQCVFLFNFSWFLGWFAKFSHRESNVTFTKYYSAIVENSFEVVWARLDEWRLKFKYFSLCFPWKQTKVLLQNEKNLIHLNKYKMI